MMKLYFKFLSMHFRTQIEHKTSFFILFVSQFFLIAFEFLEIYFLFSRFHSINGFTFEQILFSFSIINISSSLAICFIRGFDMFSNLISNGEFDRMLLRPKSTIFFTLVSRFDFTKLGRCLQAVVFLVIGLMFSNIDFTPLKILVVILMIICGIAFFAALYILYASLCFFTTEGLEFINIFTDGGRQFGAYPLSVFGEEILKFFTFIIPLALVQYYPLLYLFDINTSILNALTPVLSLIFLLPCYLLWRLGIRKYKSTGS